jgi:two-component system, OmpR family, alkaline phosphatase synthesis response regulator PhoP
MTKVLIVDDEPFVIRMLRDKLQNAGISVVSAANGKEAVGLAMSERPNLIIMDWMMPEMNGIDACKTIRTNPEHAGTPIIMLTAKGQELDEKNGRDAGATYYITKPFSPRRILRLVEECTQPSGGGRA